MNIAALFLTKNLIPLTHRVLYRNMSFVAPTITRSIHEKALIGGNWVSAKSGETFDVLNPATDEIIASIPDMNGDDTELAIQAAKKAFETWKETTAKERSVLLRSWYNLVIAKQNEMAKLLTMENGKPLKESTGEVIYGADYLEFYAEEAKRMHGEVLQSPIKSKEMILIRQPIGVVGMLTPWNFPVAMIARKAAAALAAGCTVVIKPAEDTPLSALLLASLAEEASIPPGVVNVVTSSRKNTPVVGKILCRSPDVAGISFTGSTGVGKILYEQCASTIKRLSLELGGNAPFIIFESADMDKAVEAVMVSKFRNSGQTCVCTNRIFVHEGVKKQFMSKLKAAMANLVLGNGLDGATNQGPLTTAAQLQKVTSLVKDAVSKGAVVEVGGEPHSLGKTYFQPTLLTNLNESMTIYSEEIFGPVACVISFKTEEEAIAAANNTRSGLCSYFFSNDLSQIRRVSKTLEYGMVGINEGIISCADAAFGGVKESGFGREGSRHGLDDYSSIKYLCFGNLT